MERPLEICFHNMESSKEIEAEIRRLVDQLERRGKLIGCRVTLDTPHRQHKTGNVYTVHIVLDVGGRDITVSYEPQHAKENYARHGDPHGALRAAFRLATRQLAAVRSKQRREAEPHRRRPTTTPVIPAERSYGLREVQDMENDKVPKSKSVRSKAVRPSRVERPAGQEPTLAGEPFKGGKRPDTSSPEERKNSEMARPKDSGRFGA